MEKQSKNLQKQYLMIGAVVILVLVLIFVFARGGSSPSGAVVVDSAAREECGENYIESAQDDIGEFSCGRFRLEDREGVRALSDVSEIGADVMKNLTFYRYAEGVLYFSGAPSSDEIFRRRRDNTYVIDSEGVGLGVYLSGARYGWLNEADGTFRFFERLKHVPDGLRENFLVPETCGRGDEKACFSLEDSNYGAGVQAEFDFVVQEAEAEAVSELAPEEEPAPVVEEVETEEGAEE